MCILTKIVCHVKAETVHVYPEKWRMSLMNCSRISLIRAHCSEGILQQQVWLLTCDAYPNLTLTVAIGSLL